MPSAKVVMRWVLFTSVYISNAILYTTLHNNKEQYKIYIVIDMSKTIFLWANFFMLSGICLLYMLPNYTGTKNVFQGRNCFCFRDHLHDLISVLWKDDECISHIIPLGKSASVYASLIGGAVPLIGGSLLPCFRPAEKRQISHFRTKQTNICRIIILFLQIWREFDDGSV